MEPERKKKLCLTCSGRRFLVELRRGGRLVTVRCPECDPDGKHLAKLKGEAGGFVA